MPYGNYSKPTAPTAATKDRSPAGYHVERVRKEKENLQAHLAQEEATYEWERGLSVLKGDAELMHWQRLYQILDNHKGCIEEHRQEVSRFADSPNPHTREHVQAGLEFIDEAIAEVKQALAEAKLKREERRAVLESI